MKIGLGRFSVAANETQIDREAGFTMVELLVMLAIIGIIAAIATPRVLRYLDEAKVTTTKTQIRSVQGALELYFLDNGSYPTQEEGLAALATSPPGASAWNGPYLRGENGIKDAWGREFEYLRSQDRNEPLIRSFGRDGREGGEGVDADLGS